jgi:hypothetical protein
VAVSAPEYITGAIPPANDASGPAFPVEHRDGEATHWHTGMTLRDYFAIHATPADCGAFLSEFDAAHGRFINRTPSEARYAFADAMLKARHA